MRRSALLVAAWLAGGVLAVVLASAAVGRVGNQVTGDRPAPLSATDVREELAAEAAEASTSSTAPSATDSAPTTSTTPPATTPPATTPPVPATVPVTADPAETRTYPLVGGTATLRFSPSGVTVVVANPNPGFSVEVEPEGTGLEVSFRSATHRSKLEAWWDGAPQDSVEEESGVED